MSPWLQTYEALKSYIASHGHLPDKHVVENRGLLNWAKYQRRRLRAGTMDAEQARLFTELLATRSTAHTGGRRRKVMPDSDPELGLDF